MIKSPCLFIVGFSEIAAAFRVTAIAINLNGVARAFAGRAAILAVFRCGTTAGGILTGSVVVSVCHLSQFLQ